MSSLGYFCGSGLAREAGTAMDGTGSAGVRGQARSHRGLLAPQISVSQAISCLTNPCANGDKPYPTRLTTP